MLWKQNEKLASRRFVDLIWKASTKYPVWDPPHNPVKPGDFGMIDRTTGKFERQGNIYERDDLASLVSGPVDPTSDSSEEVISITSHNAQTVALGTKFAVDAQVLKVAWEAGWNFGNHSGAVLVVHKPRQIFLPHSINYHVLAERLNGMCLVTSVTVCPAYALYLASKDHGEIALALCLESPIPTLPISAGPEVKTKWRSQYGAGIYREGNQTEDAFTVLYDLKVLRKKGWLRDSPEPQGDRVNRRLEDAQPPWTTLDDDGEEEACTIDQGYSIPVDNEDEWS